jgi:hypothetical protein
MCPPTRNEGRPWWSCSLVPRRPSASRRTRSGRTTPRL